MLSMLAAFAASIALSAPAKPTTIEAIRSNPGQFDGQWVRVQGQLNQCTTNDCALCPEEVAGCLALDWDRQRGSEGEIGANFDPVYRYASVDLVAYFDKSCFERGACLDRAPVLRQARVLRVLKRRPSSEGLNGRRRIDRIVEAPAGEAKRLIAVATANMPPLGYRWRVFAGADDPQIRKSAILCRTLGREGEPGTWPADETGAFWPSSEDVFKCFFAQRKQDGWHIDLD